MPTLTIDNQKITVPADKTILEAAEELGIIVPHFCYHKALGAVGACRMCAVNVHEGSFKGMKMACLVKVEDGMVVTTGDEKSTEFRERVSEWMMMNHPHDCPVCDEGGECQLQEMTIASGHGLRRYDGLKRTYQNQDLGPFIAQEMNRCIQCYRCIRTYQDYCGGRDFGVMGSRNRVFFGRFNDGMLESDFSGNIVDACPTGVLTDKTYRFKSRFWDLQEAPSVCPHCSLGCATVPGGRLRELQRVRSGENEEVNGFFICDRGRFGSDYVNHLERPRQARRDDEQISVTDAVTQLNRDARAMVAKYGPEAVLLLGSERASLEANWLLQRWGRDLGCRVPVLSAHEQRHQAAQTVAFDLSGQLASLEDVRQSDLVLVAGVDPLAEAPMLAVGLRQVVRNGGQVMVYDPRPVELPCEFDHQSVSPGALIEFLKDGGEDGLHVRELLGKAERPVLVGGGDILGAVGLQLLGALAKNLSNDQRPCPVYPVLGGPNSFGAALLSLPEQDDMLSRLESGKVKMLISLETDPLLDAPQSERFAAALTGLDKLVTLDYLPTPLSRDANLFIPTRTPVETVGTFINNEGRLRLFNPVLEPGIPLKESVEGNHPPREFSTETPGGEPVSAVSLLQLLLRDKSSISEIRSLMVKEFPRLAGLEKLSAADIGIRVAAAPARDMGDDNLPEPPEGAFQLIISPARYGSDLFSRFSTKLDVRKVEAQVVMNPVDAEEYRLQEGDGVIIDTDCGSFNLPLACDAALAAGSVLIENNASMAQMVPGRGLAYCQIHREASDE